MTLKRDEYGNQVQAMHPYLSQVVAFTTVSAAGAPFAFVKEPLPPVPNTGALLTKAQRTMHVRLVSTANCWITFGPSVDSDGVAVTAPVAVKAGSGSLFIPAGIPEYFWVRPAERIAAVADGGAGSLYITELANN
jgi:hypothetical protein